ncbi:hypothetical protein CYY_000481 [Polysphondylium violaceum]|uniref:ABC transporter domain-containing protein n=1 Tax=Polysphondylium violaceum TaxID=133409 RepID=A0A8J4QAU4_9MYCE|nr:hypothetical protein CYY_000481 [Polysphondylium violaceum]
MNGDAVVDINNSGTYSSAHGVQLTFKNITYKVVNQKYKQQLKEQQKQSSDKVSLLNHRENGATVEKELVLLNNVSGHIERGEFVALMGPSGSGKSTLLDILAQRKSTGTLTGSLLVNGKEMGDSYKKICSYVTQEDTLLQTATVFETLKFYADLKLPASFSEREKIERVEQVLDDIGLKEHAHSKIGGTLPGGIVLKALSGGEKKRVSIGCALVTNPSLIFLDEPTSGLDSVSALSIMKTLLNLTHKGVTVVCSVHQPRSEIWNLFHKIMLVLKGKMAFIGTSQEINKYFEDLGYPLPNHTNPADFYLDSAVLLADSNRYDDVVQKWQQYWETDGYKAISTSPPALNLENFNSVSYYGQYTVLLRRCFKDFIRNFGNVGSRLFSAVVLGLLFGACFGGLGNSQTDIQKISGVIFFLISGLSVTPFTSIAIFLSSRALFNAERAAGVYKTLPYFLATMTIEICVAMTIAFSMASVTYSIAHLRWEVSRFFWCMLVYVFIHILADCIVLTVTNICGTMDLVFASGSFLIVVYQLFAGFFVPVQQLPKAFGWLHYLSPLFPAFSSLMINEFQDRSIDCPEIGPCLYPSGNDVLVMFGINTEYKSRGDAFGVLAGWATFYFIATFIALASLNKEKR